MVEKNQREVKAPAFKPPRSLIGTFLVCILLIIAVYFATHAPRQTAQADLSTAGATLTPGGAAAVLPDLPQPSGVGITRPLGSEGIYRLAARKTNKPDQSRFEVSTYKVVKGDTVFGIADKYGLKPSTILWGNLTVLGDNPHNLYPDQVLTILPVDGVYYQWHEKDGIGPVSRYFGVTPEDIINYPGNHLGDGGPVDMTKVNIKVGTWLIVPGGHREFINTTSPFISRKDPAVARLMGPGYCGKVVDGAIGTGTFVWPTVEHWLSGFDYTPEANHPAIDIAGSMGNAIYAADSGVVVYAGWNDFGYGNVTVVDHGNGFQTLYAHQSVIRVTCGESVVKGAVIGNMGSTGRSTGPHLHFEISINGAKQNPHQFLPPP